MFPRRLLQITGYSNRYIADTTSFLHSHDLSIRNHVLKVIRFFRGSDYKIPSDLQYADIRRRCKITW